MALKNQEKVEPLLKDVPAHAARLAEELPKLGGDLAKVLRETQRLKDVAAQMRQAHKGLETALARWPQIRETLSGTATVLKATQAQLKHVVDHKEEYEAAMADTVELTDEFAKGLPAYSVKCSSPRKGPMVISPSATVARLPALSASGEKGPLAAELS